MKLTENALISTCTALIYLVNSEPKRAQQIPAFYAAVKELSSFITNVATAEKQAKQDTKGVTAQKDELRESITTDILRLNNALRSYAHSENNLVLQSLTKNFASKINVAKQNELAPLCNLLISEANGIIDTLIKLYAYTKDALPKLEEKVQIYVVKLPETMTLQNAKKTGTQTRTENIKMISNIFDNRIMTAAALFEEIDNDFYKKIINLSLTRDVNSKATQIKVMVLSASTKEPIMPNEILIRELSMRVLSPARGQATFKVKHGFYNIDVLLSDGTMRMQETRAMLGKTTLVKFLI